MPSKKPEGEKSEGEPSAKSMSTENELSKPTKEIKKQTKHDREIVMSIGQSMSSGSFEWSTSLYPAVLSNNVMVATSTEPSLSMPVVYFFGTDILIQKGTGPVYDYFCNLTVGCSKFCFKFFFAIHIAEFIFLFSRHLLTLYSNCDVD